VNFAQTAPADHPFTFAEPTLTLTLTFDASGKPKGSLHLVLPKPQVAELRL